MPSSSPYRSAAYRKAALAAALRRIEAKEERTPELIEEDLAAARKRVEQLEEELSEALEEPEEESTAARLNYGSIYARHNQRG
ncbi:hypothetical protein [Halomonas sp. H10-9-1]|uniref:hypothetical protein n=1 Tax=Halomonas sp. H10-9-1 TaxID=2950871 RepID=UPI0032DFC75B